MAIDADLSAGLIDEAEARRRRKDLEDESSFYGAMDGASKFVKGDAIAGMLIVIINIVGGLIIGVLQHGMSFTDAAQTYTILTVGDGLVASIPSILVSVGAGMLVSKAGVGAPAGEALADQLSASPKALATVAALLVGLSLTPGMPMLPFLGLAAIMAGAAWKLPKLRAAEAARIREAGERKRKGQDQRRRSSSPPICADCAPELHRRVVGGHGRRRQPQPSVMELRRQPLAATASSCRRSRSGQSDASPIPRPFPQHRGAAIHARLLVMNPSGRSTSPARHARTPSACRPDRRHLREQAEIRGLLVDTATVITVPHRGRRRTWRSCSTTRPL
jgi:flagellar biosynthesis protein FlhA